MTGRHTAPRRKRRREARRRFTSIVVLAVLVGAALVSGGALLGRDADCSGELEVSVDAAPESVGLLEDVAGELEADGAEVGGECVVFSVAAEVPTAVARKVEARADDVPDLWVPDSSAWAERVGGSPTDPTVLTPSLGRSPVVVAGRRLRRPASWQDVLSRNDVSFLDPVKSSAPVAALLALRTELGEKGRGQDLDATIGPLAQRIGGDRNAPRDLVQLAGRGGGVAVLSEQQLLDLRDQGLGRDLDAAVPRTGTMVLDYPLIDLSGASETVEAGQMLADYLESPEGAELLDVAGFRTADLTPLSNRRGVGRVRSLPAPPAGVEAGVLGRWTLLTVPARIIGVFDVSGSMDERAGRFTREELASRAAIESLELFPDQSRIGVWAFSVGLGKGDRDYRELVPVRRLDAHDRGRSHRSRVRSALGQLPSLTDGATGLHDTTLAAVRAAREGYDPKAMNAVVLLTDGRNEDPGSPSISRLAKMLASEYDPLRPVSVIAIGVGPDADADALRRIVETTGGRSYLARNPRALGEVFREALLSR